jgi:hypothetical protein
MSDLQILVIAALALVTLWGYLVMCDRVRG